MKHSITYILTLLLFGFVACSKEKKRVDNSTGTDGPGGAGAVIIRPASLGVVGDTANVEAITSAGTVLMGGGTDLDAAFKWMIERSGGGDVVILRASGSTGYYSYVFGLGKVNSVETLKIDNRELANNDDVVKIIRNAEMLFIAVGDQSDYMNYWRGTKTQDAINYLLNVKKVPIGCTSAGCAILSGFYYSGEKGSVVPAEALTNPYDSKITLYNNDFLNPPFLQNVVTDQHYLARRREGRHVAFIGRILKDFNKSVLGIAADERTAVCIDDKGKAKVFGSN